MFNGHSLRQADSGIILRSGLDISTRVDWAGVCSSPLVPPAEETNKRVLASDPADHTTVPMLSNGKCITSRLRVASGMIEFNEGIGAPFRDSANGESVYPDAAYRPQGEPPFRRKTDAKRE